MEVVSHEILSSGVIELCIFRINKSGMLHSVLNEKVVDNGGPRALGSKQVIAAPCRQPHKPVYPISVVQRRFGKQIRKMTVQHKTYIE